MLPFHTSLDIFMCALWVLTYTLVLISTLKYRYPAISPITQMIIAPFELSVLVKYMLTPNPNISYGFFAYCCWSALEVIIFAVILVVGRYPKNFSFLIVVGAVILTAIMIYLVAIKGYMFFFSYLNTFIGEVFWLIHIISNKDYPIVPLNLAFFVTKLLADLIAIPVYFGNGMWLSSVMCVGLPMLDLCFIAVYFEKSATAKHKRRRR